MLEAENRLDKMREETLITQASGESLSRLVQFYGLSKQLPVSSPVYRHSLRKSVWGARATWGCVYSSLVALFADYALKLVVDQVATRRVTYASGVNCQYNNRLCYINGSPYLSTQAAGQTIWFNPIPTSVYRGASWDAASDVELTIYPFLVRDFGCTVDILIDSALLRPPPTYLHTDVTDLARNPEEPYGGAVMDGYSSVPAHRTGDQVDGPFPIYLAGDVLGGDILDYLTALTAGGVHVKLRSKTWCDQDPIFGTIRGVTESGVAAPVYVSPARV